VSHLAFNIVLWPTFFVSFGFLLAKRLRERR